MKRFSLLCVLLLGGSSAQAQISVQSPLSDDRVARPGTSYTGEVLVVNETDQPQEFRVYLRDYLFAAGGINRFDEPGETPRSNAAWVEAGAQRVTLAPRQRMNVGYRVHVPEVVDAPGTYWSMLMVEGVPGESAESTLLDERGDRRGGIVPVTRYGIQIATHVAGGQPEFSFEDVSIVSVPDDRPVLQIDVANHGTRLATAVVSVEMFSGEGRALWRRDGQRSRIYPGTSVRERIDLSDLPAGQYEALILIDCGDDELTGAQYTVVI